MTKTVFVIDVGSNSIRLMQAETDEKTVRCVKKWLVLARLGEKAPGSVDLSEAAMQRGAEAIAQLWEKAQGIDAAAPVWAFATSAVRDAGNRECFLEMVKQRTGLTIQVLSGEQEALIGAAGALQGQDGGLIDIGGGSTELVVCRDGQVQFARSLNIGCVRARGLFAEQDAEAENWARRAFSECALPPAERTIAIGGAPTTLAAVALGLKTYDPVAVEGYLLRRAQLDALWDCLAPLTPAERAQAYCMEERRAEVILYGIAILRAFMDSFQIGQVTVSEADNLEGFLHWQLEQMEK